MPGGVTVYPNEQGRPTWMGDFGGREHIMPFPAFVNPYLFTDGVGISIVVDVAGALANATSIPLADALTVAIPAGTVLSFGSAGSKKFAKLSANAVIGDTSLTVEAIPTAVVSGDTAVYSKYGRKALKSGTVVGRTYAERDAGTPFGPAVYTDDEIYLVAFDNENLIDDNGIELYRHDSLVKENFLPEWDTLNTADAAVNCVQTVAITGTLTAGQFKVGGVNSSGTMTWSDDVAYDANLATLQAAYDQIYGSSKVVVAGTVASHTVTFSGTGYAGLPQTLISVDANEVTGIEDVSIAMTTAGVAAAKNLLNVLRELYQCIKGVQ